MKTYSSAAAVLAQVERALAARYSTGVRMKPSPQVQHARWGPLGGVLELLRAARNYSRVELSLDLDEQHAVEISVAAEGKEDTGTRSEYATAVTVAGRQAGQLRVFHEHADAISQPDRVLLKRVARQLALFLAGEGRYVLRRARQRSVLRELKRDAVIGKTARGV